MKKKDIFERFKKIEEEIKQLKCEHNLFNCYKVEMDSTYYYKRCANCNKKFDLKAEEYYKEKIKEAKFNLDNIINEAKNSLEGGF